MKRQNKHIGSTFESFLIQEGLHEQATAYAIKRVVAWQIAEAMKEQKISKNEMARRMRTSRSQLARFLDPNNDKVLLETLQRAASIVGKRVTFVLEDAPQS
jgi:antitoxin HicB